MKLKLAFLISLLLGFGGYGGNSWSADSLAVNTMGSYSSEAIKIVLSLILVLFIFYVGITLFKKYLGGSFKSNSSIKIIGGLSLGGKEKLVLVEGTKSRFMKGDIKPVFNVRDDEVLPYLLLNGWRIVSVNINETNNPSHLNGYILVERELPTKSKR